MGCAARSFVFLAFWSSQVSFDFDDECVEPFHFTLSLLLPLQTLSLFALSFHIGSSSVCLCATCQCLCLRLVCVCARAVLAWVVRACVTVSMWASRVLCACFCLRFFVCIVRMRCSGACVCLFLWVLWFLDLFLGCLTPTFFSVSFAFYFSAMDKLLLCVVCVVWGCVGVR